MRRPHAANVTRLVRAIQANCRHSSRAELITSKSSAVGDQEYDPEHLFRYSSGRWLYDENEQSSRRYRKFHVENLKEVAALTQGSRCVGLTKLPEGFFNKVFSLTLENGSEVIARLPDPNAGQSRYAVASEVATPDFPRNVVGVPVPRVLSWSTEDSLAERSGVGAEYMLMERAPGRQLSTVWCSMSPEQQFAMTKVLIEIERKLTSAALCKYGSIYYRHDCPPSMTFSDTPVTLHGRHAEVSKFVIGPISETHFWSDGIGDLDIDRGPWSTPLEFFSAIANREIIRIRKVGGKKSSEASFHSPLQSTRDKLHIELLQKFLAVLPMILPLEKEVSHATLWHHDLHEDNIFVDDEDPTRITSIIDWQNIWAAPLFMQARFPSIVDCPWPYPRGAVMPRLPDGFSNLSEDEKTLEEQKLQEVKLKKYYEIGSRRLNPVAFKAMSSMDSDDDPTVTILQIVNQTWDDGPVPLQELLIQIYQRWSNFTEKRGFVYSCPISFTEEELKLAKIQAETWAEAYTRYETLRAQILGKDGWVSHEEYDNAMHEFKLHKDELERLRTGVEDAFEAS